MKAPMYFEISISEDELYVILAFIQDEMVVAEMKLDVDEFSGICESWLVNEGYTVKQETCPVGVTIH